MTQLQKEFSHSHSAKVQRNYIDCFKMTRLCSDFSDQYSCFQTHSIENKEVFLFFPGYSFKVFKCFYQPPFVMPLIYISSSGHPLLSEDYCPLFSGIFVKIDKLTSLNGNQKKMGKKRQSSDCLKKKKDERKKKKNNERERNEIRELHDGTTLYLFSFLGF